MAEWRLWFLAAAGLTTFVAATVDVSEPVPWITFFVLTAATIVADWLLGLRGRDDGRYMSAPFLFAGVLLLPLPPLSMLVVALYLSGWLRSHSSFRVLVADWAISLVIVAAGSLTRSFLLNGPVPEGEFRYVVSTAAAAAAMTFGYRLLTAFARKNLGDDCPSVVHLLARDSLLTQFAVLLLGVPVAVLWNLQSWVAVLALPPLLLIHRAINMPALEKEARTDLKTGLHNMKAFNQALNQELQRASRFGHPIAVLMIDLDLLRHVNNAYGHQAGDVVLQGVADGLRREVREYDVAARFGGDEFVVLLVECDSATALRVAERIRRLVESLRLAIPTSLAAVGATVSVGVSTFPRDGATPEEIIYQADQAVYRAKLGGRNRVCLAPPPKCGPTVELPTPEYDPTQDDGECERGAAAEAAISSFPNAEAFPAMQEIASVAGGPDVGRRTSELSWPLRLLVMVVVAMAAVLAGLAVPAYFSSDWLGLGILVLLTLAAEAWAVDIYGGSSVSLAVVPMMAAAMLYGVPGGVVVGLAEGVTRGILRHSQPHRVVFNTAVFVLAASLSGKAFGVFDVSPEPNNLPVLILAALLASLIYYAVNTGLISLAMGLSSAENPASVWREHFRWLLVHYVVLGLLGLFLATAFSAFGLYGLVAFVAPVLAMRYAIHQYVSSTTEHVAELRRLNTETQRTNEEIASINEDLLNTLAAAIDVRDPFVYGHSTKVAEYAVAIARELEMSDAMVELIRHAALLHDIGKLGVAEAILNKPSKLDPEEYERIKTHSSLGAELLTKMRRLQHLVPAIKHHHEWFNGKGYPGGLAGAEIPIEARVLAVCDAIEAMASDRPYHRALEVDQIIVELRRCCGTQFDPAVVEAFERVIARCGGEFVSNSAQTVRQREARSFSFPSHADDSKVHRLLDGVIFDSSNANRDSVNGLRRDVLPVVR